ncbi:MAG TPA: tetratricopeptide repeat protein [bacterium (Candidatus Stahlbacteria)]|nr:tetratricopeptide repeat protein [Candidatus Stahlbacteria bacterium]
MSEEKFSELIETGEFYILSGNFHKAVEVLKKAEKLKKNARLYYNLGIAFEGLSQKEDAVEAFQATLEIEPENEKAKEHLKRLIEEKL